MASVGIFLLGCFVGSITTIFCIFLCISIKERENVAISLCYRKRPSDVFKEEIGRTPINVEQKIEKRGKAKNE